MRTSFRVFFMELRTLMTYRADFWVNFAGLTFFALIIAYFLWSGIFDAAHKTMIKGKTLADIIFYYLVAPLIFRVQQGQNIGFLSRDIYEGSLNKYLLYPLRVNDFKLATYLANSFFFLFQLFALIIIYQLIFHSNGVYSFSFPNLLLFVFVIVLNCISYYYLFCIFELAAFWFDHIWSLGVMLRFFCSFFGGALIPLVFFPEWAQKLLYYTPFPYMIDFPFQVLMGNMHIQEFFIKLSVTLIWLFFFKFLSHLIWERGKYQYTGVGI